MSQFSSKPPFNDNPFPTYPPGGHPMYNRPQHNPTNRLLIAARRAHRDGFLLDFTNGFIREPNTKHAEIHHAQRVLSKWKAVFG